MTTVLDHRSIAVDLNQCPSVGAREPVRLESTDYSALLRKLAGINVLSFTCSMVCVTFDLIFTLIMLGMGASNQSSCPIEPRIPTYLTVLGSVNLVSLCVSIIACIVHNRRIDRNVRGFYYVHCSAVVIIVLQLFNFIWLIIGSVWTFQVFNTVQYIEADQSASYCQGNLYQFTVVSIILQYVLPIVFCCCKNIPFHF